MLSFVFVNGQYQADLSNPGILSDQITVEENAFTLHLPKNYKTDQIIELKHINKAPGSRIFRHIIIAHENSEAVILESYQGEDDLVYSNDIETKLDIKPNAALSYYKWQRESEKATHTAHLIAHQARNSSLSTYHVLIGAEVSNDHFSYSLSGEGATCESIGFYSADKKRKVTINSCINHLSSYTNSKQFYKGIANDQSLAAFFGKLVVHPDIKAISAHQKNNNLLLSSKAEVDTKPELEIYSDDVQCTHGATVGQLDSEAIFYLQSRGIVESEAKCLLTHAFVNEILDALPNAIIASKIKDHMLSSSRGACGEVIREPCTLDCFVAGSSQ